MSTFDGVVKEFPEIRIDFFRSGTQTSSPPLAYFLSHVHSDHLQGLETCKSPFTYCSPATREILLKMEKYPYRMNFARRILESRQKTYRHLDKLLKTIPLETPTVIDLSPGKSIRVTLFDANHCVGAVMFLIEDDANAVLYTGDIRSELWWVNALTRHPLLLPYAHHSGQKPLRQLNCIYLDTTFANKSNPYKHFAAKADGVVELLQKVAKYPKDTVFYFDSWTFGYEEVWVALSAFLDCRVHLDQYRYNLYHALASGKEPRAEEATRLFGFKCGNHIKYGCITSEQSRLHSCEQGTGCEVLDGNFVRITPIISRHDSVEMAELGAGGGRGDLDQQHELELDDKNIIDSLIDLCASKMQGEPESRKRVIQMLLSVMNENAPAITLDTAYLSAAKSDITELEDMRLENLIPALIKMATAQQERKSNENATTLHPGLRERRTLKTDGLPKRITFPYSRHSSYTELCYLIEAFKPSDIYPCTVDRARWDQDHSMSFLFGHLYHPSPVPSFTHDQKMFREKNSELRDSENVHHTPAVTAPTKPTTDSNKPSEPKVVVSPPVGPDTQLLREMNGPFSGDISPRTVTKRRRLESAGGMTPMPTGPARARDEAGDSGFVTPNRASLSPKTYSAARREEISDGLVGEEEYRWEGLVSVSGHQEQEIEL